MAALPFIYILQIKSLPLDHGFEIQNALLGGAWTLYVGTPHPQIMPHPPYIYDQNVPFPLIFDYLIWKSVLYCMWLLLHLISVSSNHPFASLLLIKMKKKKEVEGFTTVLSPFTWMYRQVSLLIIATLGYWLLSIILQNYSSWLHSLNQPSEFSQPFLVASFPSTKIPTFCDCLHAGCEISISRFYLTL